MTTKQERSADEEYEARNDPSPVPGTEAENSYLGTGRGEPIDVQADEEDVGDKIEPELERESLDQPGMDVYPIGKIETANSVDVQSRTTKRVSLAKTSGNRGRDAQNLRHQLDIRRIRPSRLAFGREPNGAGS
jgi:hypothetical protein